MDVDQREFFLQAWHYIKSLPARLSEANKSTKAIYMLAVFVAVSAEFVRRKAEFYSHRFVLVESLGYEPLTSSSGENYLIWALVLLVFFAVFFTAFVLWKGRRDQGLDIALFATFSISTIGENGFSFWIFMLAIGLGVFAASNAIDKIRAFGAVMLCGACLCFAGGYEALSVVVNVVFDFSPPYSQAFSVLDVRAGNLPRGAYRLALQSEDKSDPRRISVKFFNGDVSTSKHIVLVLKAGALGNEYVRATLPAATTPDPVRGRAENLNALQ